METINTNIFIIINYATLICLAFLLTWTFGRKMPTLKKITTICALIFIFIIGLPIVQLVTSCFFQNSITIEQYEWTVAHPNTLLLYNNLLSFCFTMILCSFFIKIKPRIYNSPTFVIPFILLVTSGVNYLTLFLMTMDVHPYSTLFNNTGIILILFSLLTIIFALWPSKKHATPEPKLGIVLALITLIVYSLKFGALCYLLYTYKSIEIFYIQSIPNILVHSVCLSLILLSGLFLLRYIIYQNPMSAQFSFFNSLSYFKKRGVFLISTCAIFALALFCLIYTPFESQVKKLWIEEFNTRKNFKDTCLSSPIGLASGLEWTLSIPQNDPYTNTHKYLYDTNMITHREKITRLDTLSDIGFLKKYEEEILITFKGDNKYVPGFRYHITPTFKAYGSGGTYPCLKYSNKGPQFMGIDSIDDLTKKFNDEELKILKRFNITKYVEVKFFVGVEEDDLFPWVQDPLIVQSFDFKAKRTHSMKIANVEGAWIPIDNLYLDDLKNIDPNVIKQLMKYQKQLQQQNRIQNRWNNMQSNGDHTTIYPHQIESGIFSNKSRILKEFKKDYQSGSVGNPYWYHLDRPGSTSDLPVDIQNDLGRCEGSKLYKVGIITEQNSSLEKRDPRILDNTLPYLQNLVERGILFSYEGQISLKNQNNQSYSGLYFEPTEQYQKAFSLCLNLNEPRFEILKASIFSGHLSFDTIAYYDRPSWATDKMLKNFEELRLILEYGSTNIARNPAYDLPFKVRNTPIRY